MKNIKKLICISLTIVCVFSAIYVNAFSDLDENSGTGKAVLAMREKGYIQGFEDGTFRPDATLTRAEFVTIINKMYGYSVESENIFNDIKETDWFYHDVLAAVQAGYIRGMGDGRFAPNQSVTREQVCVMLNSILNVGETYFKPDIVDEVSDWARESVEKLVANFLFTLESGGKFRATMPITRGEACVALEKCIIEVDFDAIEPIDLESLAREELERRLTEVINCMEKTVIPSYTFDETIRVGNMLVESMKKYLENPEHDYVADGKATYEVYRYFDVKRVNEFKSAIYDNMNINEIAILFDFFYIPEITEVK